MTWGGDGVLVDKPLIEVSPQAGSDVDFPIRRFEAGGRMKIVDGPRSRRARYVTCVLCGGVITDAKSSFEHPLPQWLHRYCGNAGDIPAKSFAVGADRKPTWRQLCLKSHSNCNTLFARRVEDPAISPFKRIVEGGTLSSNDIELVFDWLDKVKISACHMGVAIQSHKLTMDYREQSFANKRVGAYDRFMIILRLNTKDNVLDLNDCLHEGFLTTPSSIIIRARDLVIIYVSNAFLLSPAFGLGYLVNNGGKLDYNFGNQKFEPGFGSRTSRLKVAIIIAQPMRRQMVKLGYLERNPALQENGDGRIFELRASRWQRIGSISFANLPKLDSKIGLALANLESVEWLLLSKEYDTRRYGRNDGFHMNSYGALNAAKNSLIDLIGQLRYGLAPPTSDRI